MGYHERSLLEHAATVDTSHLNYVFPNGVKGLKDISFALPAGARCLLVGGMEILQLKHDDSIGR